MNAFSTSGAANFPNYWFEKSENPNECQPTSTITGFSVFATRDYMRCVCDNWGQEEDDCLAEVPDPTDSGNAAVASFMPHALFTSALAILSIM